MVERGFMKKLINRLIAIAVIIASLLVLNVKAYEYDYEITKFDIEMIVNSDNSFDIKETIGVYYNVPKHGIYRTIPLENNIKRADNTTSKTYAMVENVSVNQKYTANKEGNYEYVIRIGSEDETLTGSQEYVINYKYVLNYANEEDFDELYYNIIGTDWDTTIKNVTFKITMPKDFDKSKLGFSKGKSGSTNSTGITYQVDGNIITGSFDGTLKPSEGLTVRLELPKGYFESNNDYINDNRYEYIINNYDIEMKVNLDNTFDIKETIDTYFNQEKHGIYRKLPLRNEVERLDGSKTINRAKVTNLKVNQEYTTSKKDNYFRIQIGNPNKVIKGENKYIINYKYNLGSDKNNKYDELYYNIIGTEWDTKIKNVTFKITMPKSFDESKLGFAKGEDGSTDSRGITYQVDGNVITGSYNKSLAPYEGLTIRLELPEGYFEGVDLIVDLNILLMFIIPIASLVISIFLWYKFGIDDKVIETIEFYPPKGYNSLEIGYLYKGIAENEDVISLLIYLANKGYIKIAETEAKSLFTSVKSFEITKLKEYDGDNINEKLFFKGLFKTGDKVTESDLRNSFYVTMNEILGNINTSVNNNQIFDKETSKKTIIIVILMIITFITMILVPSMDYSSGIISIIMTIFTCLFLLPFYAIGLFAKLPLLFRIVWLGFMIFLSSFFVFETTIWQAIQNDYIYLFAVIIDLLSLIGMGVACKLMAKRTKYGLEMLGKIKGFKTFLETAEKEKLEALVLENPTYFYDILPYTYVLDVSNKWMEKFESIAVEPPTWYDSSDTFDIVTFSSFVSTTIASATSSMSSSPSSSSDSDSGGGGGSSGGGSSGGGSGGGGGGSW